MRRGGLSRKGVVLFLVAFLAGYLPSIIYEFQHPGAQLFRFGGRILALDRSALSSSDLLGTVVRKALWRLSTVPASLARIPVLSVSLVGGLNAAVFAAGLGAVAYGGRVREALRDKKLSSAAILLVFVVWYVIFYATLVGAKEARYMLPLMSLYPLFTGALGALLYKRSRALCLVVLALLLVNNGLDLRRFLSDRRPHGYKALTSWLQAEGVVHGYSDFETAYPVVFGSLQKITMTPTLFHSTFSDRWPQQTAEVRKHDDAVFVVDTLQRPQAAARIERSLGELGVSYKKAAVEEFFVYKDLSRRVLPEELDVSGEHP